MFPRQQQQQQQQRRYRVVESTVEKVQKWFDLRHSHTMYKKNSYMVHKIR
jgi:hypothetical protein